MLNNPLTASAPGRVFLEKIVAATQSRISRLKSQHTFEPLLSSAPNRVHRTFLSAMRSTPPAIIAEIKKASPSKGLLRTDFDPLRLAHAYELGGAAALSVVTEPEFFQGSDSWIPSISAASSIPILRKDFVLDPIQVAEAAFLGADAILLIARLLSVGQMKELQDAANRASLDVLFEAHDEDDLAKISSCDAKLVGVNARNLDTFVVDTVQFKKLKPRIPHGAVAIAESGIDSPAQIAAAINEGYSGFLIGESLVKSDDPAAMIRSLRSGGPS
jgi:indole-3-glycerol phosphate synthase